MSKTTMHFLLLAYAEPADNSRNAENEQTSDTDRG